MPRSPRRAVRTSVVLAVTAMTTTTATALAPGASAESATLSPTGSLVVTLRGNGHGHGMSQYGAEGAALKGLNWRQILNFYYPGTSVAILAPSSIRVKLSGFPSSSLTVAAYTNLYVTGIGSALPTAGVSKYRLVPSRDGFALQRLASAKGSLWRTIKAGLPDGSRFDRSGNASVRLFRGDGSSVRYLGLIRGIRSGAGAYPVNQVSLDNYTAGVIPSEIPTSWAAHAVYSQAVAARSYGRYAVESEAKRTYDICDTTQCQVYGGHTSYDAAGHVVARDYQSAAVATANRVLRYQGRTVFAQFSASNGGAVADGGQPYLRAKPDPYDAAAPNNPYRSYTRTIAVRSLAADFGLAKVTGIAISRRDGTGSWGGRVTAGYLTGTTSKGVAKRVAVTGYDLQDAFGAGTTLFTVRRG